MTSKLVQLTDGLSIPFPAGLDDPEGSGQGETVDTHSWKPQSLITLAANPPERPTIGRLLYPGKRTLLSGETESLKTWLALILAKAELDIGLPLAWVDMDAMGPGALLERLRLLGVTDDVIADRFLYYEPVQRLVADLLDEVCATIRDRGIRLLVGDAFNPWLHVHGLDPNSTLDIEAFWREVADPITRAGAAPVLLDHVAKNADSRGKYAYGSERKASGAIVHIGFKGLTPFSRGVEGSSLLSTYKDRPGFLPRPTIGKLVLTSDGGAVAYRLDADLSRTGDTFRPTTLMEKVSRALERESEPRSANWVETTVDGKGESKRTALNRLVDEGFLSEEQGPRKARLFTSVRPYIEREEQEAATSSRPSPNLVPDLRSTPSSVTSSSSLPYRDEVTDEVDMANDLVPRPRPRPLTDLERARRFDALYPPRRDRPDQDPV
jgi:hypothetical protein